MRKPHIFAPAIKAVAVLNDTLKSLAYLTSTLPSSLMNLDLKEAVFAICLMPLDGRFQRALPRSAFDRLVNFAKFRLIERILPGA